MGKEPDRQPMKTIEELLQHEMIEKEAIVRLLIKKGVFTPEEFRGEVHLLSQKVKKQRE